LGAVSDKYGEKFPLGYFNHGEKITTQSSQNMLADYCWKLTEEVTNEWVNGKKFYT